MVCGFRSDDLNDYWTYLGVPLPLRLILSSDPSERVTFEGDGEALTIKTRCALFNECVGLDPTTAPPPSASSAAAAEPVPLVPAADRGHMMPHRWYDLITFRGSICLKQVLPERLRSVLCALRAAVL